MRTLFFNRTHVAFLLGLVLGMYAVSMAVQAATDTLFGPESEILDENTPDLTSDNLDPTGYENIVFSFNYDAETFDDGDSFLYGWSDGTTDETLGTVTGADEVGTTTPDDEIGTISVTLPASAETATEFTVYVIATVDSGSDAVSITDFMVEADQLVGVFIDDPATDGDTISGTYPFMATYYDEDDEEDIVTWFITAVDCSGVIQASHDDGESDPGTLTNTSFEVLVDMSTWVNGTYCLTIDPDESGGAEDVSATRTFVIANEDEEEEVDDLSCDLSVGDSSVSAGATTTLFWVTTGAASAAIDPDIGSLRAESGSIDVNVTADTTYTLTVFGFSQEEVSCTASVGIAGGGSTGTRVNRSSTPEPAVLGAATSTGSAEESGAVCGPYLLEYLHLDWVNNPLEVIKLQAFLTNQGFYTPISGVFDTTTEDNVRLFQAAHAVEVLQPWVDIGLHDDLTPTGYVYKTTQWKINSLVCGSDLPFPDLP